MTAEAETKVVVSSEGIPALSVIIPLGPDEPEWPELFDDLQLLPSGCEVILVAIEGQGKPAQLAALPSQLSHLSWIWLTTTAGRAIQLNCGAAVARGQYLWFLHADTRLNQHNLEQLQSVISAHPNCLYYFDLWFYDKECRRLWINEFGARLRSDWMKQPFGDQGLCLSRAQFLSLPGYRTDLAYGEDHVFVWESRYAGIPLQRCPSRLATSARKYHQQGWGHLTLKYKRLWLKQAWETYKRLKRGNKNEW